MDPAVTAEIEAFLGSVGQPDLFRYYGVGPEASETELEDAIKKKRTWAQGQQANPKYKAEALFLIRRHSMIRAVLVEELPAYRAWLRQKAGPRPSLATDPPTRPGSRTDPHRVEPSRGGAPTPRPPEHEVVLLSRGENLAEAAGSVARADLGDPLPEPPPNRGAEASRPRLDVRAPSPAILSRRGGDPLSIEIRNVGGGHMSGSVSVDQPWLRVNPTSLNPDRSIQSCQVELAPGPLPPGEARATVLIRTLHGQLHRVEVTLEAPRRQIPWVPIGLGVGAVVVLGLMVAVLGHMDMGDDPVLHVQVDPPDARVFVDDSVVPAGGDGEVRLSADEPHKLRAEAVGFHPVDKLLPATPAGGSWDVKLHLERVGLGAWTAPEGVQPVQLGADAGRAIDGYTSQLVRCFRTPGAPPIVQATFKVAVGPDGTPLDVTISDSNHTNPAIEECVRGVFAGMRFPRFAGTYGVLQKTFTAALPEGS